MTTPPAEAPVMRSDVHPAAPHPCAACPWRIANQGKPHPHGWYTKKNLQRLWAGMRRGEASMSCHPTDPDNLVPEGQRPVPDSAKTRECTGALILMQREIMRFQNEAAGDIGRYRRLFPGGLMKAGLVAVVHRHLYGGVPMFGALKMSTPDLNQEGIGAPGIEPWKARS